MSDASFKEGRDYPLKLIAQDASDLSVISAMAQDAVLERKNMLFESGKHSFTLLLNRFRWEDVEDAQNLNRSFERVQSLLMFKSVLKVQYIGFDIADQSSAFALIGIRFENEWIMLSFAGKGEIAMQVECVDAILSDVSKPYVAKSKQLPQHKDF